MSRSLWWTHATLRRGSSLRRWFAARLVFRDQLGSYDRSCEFPGQPVVDATECANRYCLQGLHTEFACGYQAFETSDGYLVEPAVHFAEPCCTIVANICPPADEGGFREEQMCP